MCLRSRENALVCEVKKVHLLAKGNKCIRLRSDGSAFECEAKEVYFLPK